MSYLCALDELRETSLPLLGGKTVSLYGMGKAGMTIPRTHCLTTKAYQRFVDELGLAKVISFELGRKSFDAMRWEEVWDAALRIRGAFMRSKTPAWLDDVLRRFWQTIDGQQSIVVRSSAPHEDSVGGSFAGLHETVVNITNYPGFVDAVRQVWASLWSDRALLYRRELGLDVVGSQMACVIQPCVVGTRSGVAFSINPLDQAQAVVEAVHGLNQGLVDGVVEPDRWLLDRKTGAVQTHVQPRREQWVVPARAGVHLDELPQHLRQRPPVTTDELAKVYGLAMAAEAWQGAPQDVEWTIADHGLVLLQSRAVTTRPKADPHADDRRPWYGSLTGSFESLRVLERRILDETLPGMQKTAETMASWELSELDDETLAESIEEGQALRKRWVDEYWRSCIPFAHGVRLFGQVYNDRLKPADPYEFVSLLQETNMFCLERNGILEALADCCRHGSAAELDRQIDTKMARLRELSVEFAAEDGRSLVELMVKRLAQTERRRQSAPSHAVSSLLHHYLDSFDSDDERVHGQALLDLARSSWRLRDDDNVYLARVTTQLERIVDWGRQRIAHRCPQGWESLDAEVVCAMLRNPALEPPSMPQARPREKAPAFAVAARQLRGQPASGGVASGPARVLRHRDDGRALLPGEIIVCDVVEPTMTFIVPLAAAIVERRGGMLIHSAIVAREYGIPCVNGVVDVTSFIKTGDWLTVDGHLGIVVIEASKPAE